MKKQKLIENCFFCNGAADFVHLLWWTNLSPFYGEKIGLCWSCYYKRTEELLQEYKNIVLHMRDLEKLLEEKSKIDSL